MERTGIWIPVDVAEEVKRMLKEAKTPDRAQWICGYLFGYFETETRIAKKQANNTKEENP